MPRIGIRFSLGKAVAIKYVVIVYAIRSAPEIYLYRYQSTVSSYQALDAFKKVGQLPPAAPAAIARTSRLVIFRLVICYIKSSHTLYDTLSTENITLLL
jgi:hypothetical protein